MKQSKCPNCGANIPINNIQDSYECEYCGTTLEKEALNFQDTANQNTYYQRPFSENQNGYNSNGYYQNGYNQNTNSQQNIFNSRKINSLINSRKIISLVLCALGFFGFGGIHDFYLGKIGSGIIKFITLNWFYIGTIIDLISLSEGKYKDSSGQSVI